MEEVHPSDAGRTKLKRQNKLKIQSSNGKGSILAWYSRLPGLGKAAGRSLTRTSKFKWKVSKCEGLSQHPGTKSPIPTISNA
jgi:hypothetical protein